MRGTTRAGCRVTESFRRHLRVGLALGLVAVGTGGAHAAQTPPPPPPPPDSALLLQNIRVFDPVSGSFSEPTDLLIRGGRIAATGRRAAAGPGVVELNAAGRFALPGLWDSHVHLSFLTLMGDSTLVATLEAFARNGVTSVRDLGGPLDTIAALSRRVGSGALLGPSIYYAGPLLTKAPLLGQLEETNAALTGMAFGVTSPASLDSVLDRLVAQGATMTKAIDVWDPALFRHYLGAARSRGLRVVFDPGVPILNAIPADTALAMGVTSIEHAQAVWLPVLRDDLRQEVEAFLASGAHLREGKEMQLRIMALGDEGVSSARLRALADRWASTGVYFAPTLQTTEVSEGTPEKYRRPFEQRHALAPRFARELSARGVRLLVGQDQVQADGTWDEMERLALAGVSPLEILRGATLYPAQFLGIDDRVGTLQNGKRADIVIVEANPVERIGNIRSVWRVILGGRLLPSVR